MPFLNEQEEDSPPITGWNCYAVSKVKSIIDFYDLDEGNIEVTYLKYPLFCVQFSASNEHLEKLAKVLHAASAALSDAPYNIGFLNRPSMDDEGNTLDSEDSSFVDVYLFARSKERSSVLPSLKLGVSEAMGLFHAQSEEELEILKAGEPTMLDEPVEENEEDEHDDDDDDEPPRGPMAQALQDISYEDGYELWDAMKAILMEQDAMMTDDGQ